MTTCKVLETQSTHLDRSTDMFGMYSNAAVLLRLAVVTSACSWTIATSVEGELFYVCTNTSVYALLHQCVHYYISGEGELFYVCTITSVAKVNCFMYALLHQCVHYYISVCTITSVSKVNCFMCALLHQCRR